MKNKLKKQNNYTFVVNNTEEEITKALKSIIVQKIIHLNQK